MIFKTSVTLTEENKHITVTIVNRIVNQEPETGSIIIEKLVKLEVTDEEVIPSNRTFIFNIYDHESGELVRENVEVEVTDGAGSTEVGNLPLSIYRVEEVINEAYAVTLDPAGGIVDITEAEDNTVSVVVTNTPRPVLLIEKILHDAEGVPIVDSDIEFIVILDGGEFDEEAVTFSVNEPAELYYSHGLEFGVAYTVTEVEHADYNFVSIDPNEPFEITDENHEVTVTVINEMQPANGNGVTTVTIETEDPDDPEEDIVVEPEEPETAPDDPEEEIEVELEEPETEPGDPEEEVIIEPEEPETEPEEEKLVLDSETPLATPSTGGALLTLLSLGLALTGSGVLLRKYKVK